MPTRTRLQTAPGQSAPETRTPAQMRPAAGLAAPVVVLKFDRSLFRTPDHAPIVASEVYRRVRDGARVVAVVSAADEAAPDAYPGDDAGAPGLQRVGEAGAAARLALALERIGVRVEVLDPAAIGLAVQGADAADAEPVAVDATRLLKHFEACEVLIAPGSAAHEASGGLAPLGAGGADVTAVFLAHALGAERLQFLRATPEPSGRLDWDTARSCAIAAPKALDAAERAGRPVEVATCGAADATVIGASPARICTQGAPEPAHRLDVVLLGFGTVGRGIYEHLILRPNLYRVRRILVRDPLQHAGAAPQALFTTNPEDIAATPADLLIEAMGGTGLAGRLVCDALNRGVDVVTANKALVATQFGALHAAAARTGAHLRFSASVGGGAPVLEAVSRIAETEEIIRVEGILNGTSNFVLARLAEGASLADAVRIAQEKGFAEADPSGDIDGKDAAEKIALVAHAAFGEAPALSAIPRASLRDLEPGAAARAHAGGGAIKQIATCERGAGGARVTLEVVGAGDPFTEVYEERNAVRITLANGGVAVVRGKGAGRWPTAEAAFADVEDIRRARTA